MANQSSGLIGHKLGMTQMFNDQGEALAVTVIDVTGVTVLNIKTEESKDGYNAVQLGLGEKKANRVSKPLKGHYDKLGLSPKQHVKEIRVTKEGAASYEVGKDPVPSSIFTEGEKVDVTGTSKGRGFAGVMKRYNFRGFIRTHGTHEFFRHGGSIGTRLTPGHVLKGKKMPGHMGAETKTVQNLQLIKIDDEKNLLYVKGGVPGPNRGVILIRKAVK